jgi:hypothetical protein
MASQENRRERNGEEADAARLELCRNFTKLQAVFFSQRLTENATRNARRRCKTIATAAISATGALRCD